MDRWMYRALIPALLVAALGAGCTRDQGSGAVAENKPARSAPVRPECAPGERDKHAAYCAFQERLDDIQVREAQLPADSLVGIYAYGNGVQGLTIGLDVDGWAGVHEWSDIGSPAPRAGHYSLRDGVLVVELEQ